MKFYKEFFSSLYTMTLYKEDPIVTSDKVVVKPSFSERYKLILQDEYDAFMKYSFTYLRKCIRINTLKTSVVKMKERLEKAGWVLEPIPWCPEGFFVQGHATLDRYDIGNMPEHALGYFYIQESASMIPPVVLFSDVRDVWLKGSEADKEKQLEVLEDYKVLDFCAAPGSKTTQLAMYMRNQGLLVANDIDLGRLMPLTLNLQRMGVHNFMVTHNAFQRSKHNPQFRNPFEEEGAFFDRILVDAPCSGTGTIRRSFKALSMYSPHLVRRLMHTQKGLIKNAFTLLKKGGIMVYSTCTQEPAENEAVVSHLLETFPDAELMEIDLPIKRQKAITSFPGLSISPEVEKCLRIYPQDNDTEGFFVAKIRKKEK